jgi:hypothetical protein
MTLSMAFALDDEGIDQERNRPSRMIVIGQKMTNELSRLERARRRQLGF